MKSITKNTLAFILGTFIAIILLVSLTNRSYIDQKVRQSYSVDCDACIITIVYYQGQIVKIWTDNIDDNFNDSIKCYRYHKGKEMIKELKHINKIKCQ